VLCGVVQLEEKKVTMEKELVVYDDLAKLRSDSERAKEAAMLKKQHAQNTIGELKAGAAQKKKEFDKVKQQVRTTPAAPPRASASGARAARLQIRALVSAGCARGRH
jgi:hypothetical protein